MEEDVGELFGPEVDAQGTVTVRTTPSEAVMTLEQTLEDGLAEPAVGVDWEPSPGSLVETWTELDEPTPALEPEFEPTSELEPELVGEVGPGPISGADPVAEQGMFTGTVMILEFSDTTTVEM